MSPQLSEENALLRARLEELEGQLANREQEVVSREDRIAWLNHRVKQLEKLVFGAKSERLSDEQFDFRQLDLFREAVEELEEEAIETEEITYEREKKKRTPRKDKLAELHRERIVLDVDEEIRFCGSCSKSLEKFGEDITEELEFIPAKLYVREYVRPKYSCPCCRSGVLQEPLPDRPLPKALPSAGLLAHVIVSKYVDHLPLYRQEKIFKRHGLAMSRKTLCDWVHGAAQLIVPTFETLKRSVLQANSLQADETRLHYRDPRAKGKLSCGWIWSYGIPWEEVIYDFTEGRSQQGPREILGDYEGHLQTDGYAAYDFLERGGSVVRLGCWAHARRGFFGALEEEPRVAGTVLARIQKLYRVEREAKKDGLGPQERLQQRQEHSRPVLREIQAILEREQDRLKPLPKSALGEAIQYVMKRWPQFERYTEVPDAEIDNNASESSMRSIVLGRKNWLFAGSEAAGKRAAKLLSLIETARRLKADPFEYLRDLLQLVAEDSAAAAELTPRRWLELREEVTARHVDS